MCQGSVGSVYGGSWDVLGPCTRWNSRVTTRARLPIILVEIPSTGMAADVLVKPASWVWVAGVARAGGLDRAG